MEGLTPFIRNLSSPVLAANLILDDVPKLENEPNLHKSIILEIDDTKIGIIGYLTPDTRFLAPKNKVKYEDEVPAIKREVETLKKQGVKILIALGHSGYMKDLEIARNVPDIDLVIGGHSNTFLWNGKFTDEKPETPQGPYPAMVTQPSGRKVPVVQAYAYTKYLGKLHLFFDSEGEIIKYDGLPLLLDHEIPRDPELLKTVDHYRSEIDKINNEVLGQSKVVLDGDCRLVECNMGNLFTDAILDYTQRYYPDYRDVKIAVVQGGRIRTSIDHPERPIKIIRGDLIAVLPFSDTLTAVTMNGSVLKQTLEHSVSTWRPIDSTGQFLQMAGMKVTYDLAKPAGSRVVSAQALCSGCEDTKLAAINDNYTYKVFMPSFLAEGGDNYSVFENLPKEVVAFDELKCAIDYIDRYSPVKPEVEDRITLLNKDVIMRESQTINRSDGLFISFSVKFIAIVLLFIQW